MDSIERLFDILSRSNVGSVCKNNRIKGDIWVSHLSSTLSRVAHHMCAHMNTHIHTNVHLV